MTETELKLSVRDGRPDRLHRLPLVAQYARGEPSTRRLFSIYYDTPDLDLLAAGYALRVRQDGEQWVQALKSGGRGAVGLHDREERETEVLGPQPWLDNLREDTVFMERLGDPTRLEQVQARFETDFERTAWRLGPDPETEVELALDRGEVRCGNQRTPLCEIELELKAGEPAVLFELAHELARDLDLRLEDTSKAQRGYALLRPPAVTPCKAAPLDLHRNMPTEDALAAILWNGLDQAKANEAAALDGEDIEGVHQMRVGFRRFRSALALFRNTMPKAARQEVQAHLRPVLEPLGPARDWDVFVEEHLRTLLREREPTDSLRVLLSVADVKRLEAHTRLVKVLESRTYHQALLAAARWLACRGWREGLSAEDEKKLALPLEETASALLARAHRRVLRRGKAVRKQDLDALHALRIEVKRLRYAVEFLCGIYPEKAARKYRKSVRRLQEMLGHLNDGVVADTLLAELRTVELPEGAVETLSAHYEQQRKRMLKQLPKAWTAFEKRKRFWK